MSGVCQMALPETPHKVCHVYFARDVGEDLYAGPQQALCRRLRALKVQTRLREQRKGQTEWLLQKLEQRKAHLVLGDLLLKLGRLPKQLLRQENFVDDLLAVYEDQCLEGTDKAA